MFFFACHVYSLSVGVRGDTGRAFVVGLEQAETRQQIRKCIVVAIPILVIYSFVGTQKATQFAFER